MLHQYSVNLSRAVENVSSSFFFLAIVIYLSFEKIALRTSRNPDLGPKMSTYSDPEKIFSVVLFNLHRTVYESKLAVKMWYSTIIPLCNNLNKFTGQNTSLIFTHLGKR